MARILVSVAFSAVLLSFMACTVKDFEDTPTGSTPVTTTTASTSVTLTAPTLVSPPTGGEVREGQPTLTVSNATASDGSPLTYAFQVASDASFMTVVAQTSGVAPDPSGRTSWQVSAALENRQYFWRARARTSAVEGPYSTVADFRVNVVRPDPPPAGALIFDPLTNGHSVGEVSGGRFVSQGWQVTSKADYLRYEIDALSSGYVEWDNTGLRATNPGLDNYMLFGMWDPSAGPYRENPYRVHLQKLDTNHNRPYVRLRWIANEEEHNAGYNFLGWEPSRVYRWRLEWGPEAGGNFARVLLDGGTIIQERYTRTYRPQMHTVELGIAERQESIVNVVYANVKIGPR